MVTKLEANQASLLHTFELDKETVRLKLVLHNLPYAVLLKIRSHTCLYKFAKLTLLNHRHFVAFFLTSKNYCIKRDTEPVEIGQLSVIEGKL